ncbi:extracellular solute-binding protein [Lachnospiraceae bacterium OttesenSCG-928-D06]|nr:extracellular solute-binding protein [Lachnospiraceae bacterium OttesenSCG-928-D06]
MRSRKLSIKFTGLLLAMSMLAGCGSATNTVNDTGLQQSSEESVVNGESEQESFGSVVSSERPVANIMLVDHYGRALSNTGSEDVIQAVKDFTEIDIDFRWVANDSYDDVLGITLMDKSNMPMIIASSELKANIVQAAKDGAFWDLNGYIWDEEKYPYLSQMSVDVSKGFTVDGQLIGICRTRPIGRNGLGYREDWAEVLGLGEPETIEDVYNMMYAFTYDDPDGNGIDDTYGLSLCKYTGPLDIIQAWFGAGNQWVEENGQLIPSHQTKEYMEALKWMRKMYEEGLIYDDWATRETNTWTDDVKNGECGMFLDVIDNSRRIWDYFVNEEIPAVTGEGYASMKLVGAIALAEGETPSTLATSGSAGCFLITKAGADTEEELEACLKFLDRMCAPEMRILADFGIEGRDHTINDGGNIVDSLSDREIQDKPQTSLGQALPGIPYYIEGMATKEKSEREITQDEIMEINIQYAIFNPALGYLASSSVNAEMGTDLKDIIDRARTQYICGLLDDAGLQEQFEVWAQRGGNNLVNEINEMYKADKNSSN